MVAPAVRLPDRVVQRHKKRAICVWVLILGLILAYSAWVIVSSIQDRNNPSVSLRLEVRRSIFSLVQGYSDVKTSIDNLTSTVLHVNPGLVVWTSTIELVEVVASPHELFDAVDCTISGREFGISVFAETPKVSVSSNNSLVLGGYFSATVLRFCPAL